MTKRHKRVNAQRMPKMERSHFIMQSGLTLVELLVALVISTVVVIAAFSALIISRQGFVANDTASQLRDNARFLTDLIQRIGVQAGYLDYRFAVEPPPKKQPAGVVAPIPEPDVKGFNNAIASATEPDINYTTRDSSTIDGSDILVLRYQPSETYPGGDLDNSMVNCMGVPAQSRAIDRTDRVISVFHIAHSNGEPSLMCTTKQTNAAGILTIDGPQPIIRGVETFQVLYGVDGVTPNAKLPATVASANIPTRYLRADQLEVIGDANETNKNWGRVRSLKVGMVIRGVAGSAPEVLSQTYFPFGSARSSNSTDPKDNGTAMRSTDDPGTTFTPPSDNRLRQVVTFVVHLRNGHD